MLILSVLYSGGMMMQSSMITVGELSAFLLYAIYGTVSLSGKSLTFHYCYQITLLIHCSIHRFIFIIDLKYQQDIFSLLVHLFKECMHFFTGITSFYAELMRGIGASARIWELTDRIPKIPITGGFLRSPSIFL